ncbi:MAG: hypothetical protein OSB26_14355 [Woeseiaceae bacterium]|jgi:hypothetical protein|nr:hypothetical protein [Woeseiaceae bacterium]|tara:strand:- start:209 stop:421 length:213 start_codon:yes stop_codon:yes gene_type:complete
MNSKVRNAFFVTYFLVCLLANIWPVAQFANKIQPMIFGLPFFLFWVVLWSCLAFVGIVALYISDAKAGAK